MAQLRMFTLVAALAAAIACEEKQAGPKEEATTAKDGGGPRFGGVDKNLAEAVIAVAGGQGDTGGPPATGVFTKAAADKEIPPGAPPKLTLGAKGSEPSVTFATPVWKAGKKRDVTVTVSIQTGPQSALPTVDVTFSIEPSDVAASASAPDPNAVTNLVATVTGAKLAAEQPGRLPPGLGAEIAKLKGCKVKLEASPTGGGAVVGFEAASGVNDDLGQIPRSAADSLALALLPFPKEPVGVGAYWMIASREPFVGVDALAYRMVKLEKIEGDHAGLSVSSKRYVGGGHIGLSGLPPHEIQEFSGNGTGQLLVSVKDPVQLHGEATDVLMANLAPQGGGPPGQRLGMQLQIRSMISGK